jgi:predicted RNA binding protein YcfA (HicA-like mRNA interferase family)
MSERLRIVPFKTMRAVAIAAGFEEKRRVGSHVSFQDAEGRTTVIPDHGSRELGRGLTRKIISDMGMTIAQYHDLLEKV